MIMVVSYHFVNTQSDLFIISLNSYLYILSSYIPLPYYTKFAFCIVRLSYQSLAVILFSYYRCTSKMLVLCNLQLIFSDSLCILHCNALSDICFVIACESRFWNFNIANKTIMNHKLLDTALAGTFHTYEESKRMQKEIECPCHS